MDISVIEAAAKAAGIADSYISASGEPVRISPSTQEKILDALGNIPLQSSALPPVNVFRQGEVPRILLQDSVDDVCHWRLQPETGKAMRGGVVHGFLTLPENLPLGYYKLCLLQGRKVIAESRVIIAPARCYEPEAIQQGNKTWGACVQLYTLRSEENWGIGDFADLKQMVSALAAQGADFVGLNPLHALYPASPDSASPYSPSSRRWLNIIYIAVHKLPDFQLSSAAQLWWQNPEVQQQLQAARASDNVDYPQVTALKLTGLKLAYQYFASLPHDIPRVVEFEQFCKQHGESLQQQATYDALHAWLKQQDANAWGWPAWPVEYQQWDSSARMQFRKEHGDEIRFYAWLQWLAQGQLQECQQTARDAGMLIGLYRDLAVGVTEGGTETWCDRELYCLKASVGAPPDILGPLGQNWGLPPMSPQVMRQRGYQPFIDLIQANMKACGALRIDHVMGLLRLWWVPQGCTAVDGAFVSYPVDDLLAILALESQRHQCMVIGEDLGTVPAEIVAKLRDNGVYSYKVFYFERAPAPDSGFYAPQDYPAQAMTTLSTHDMPTLYGYWQADDLTLGQHLGLYPDAEVLASLYADREHAKQRMLDSLHSQHSLPEEYSRNAHGMMMNPVLNRGIHLHVAQSNSALLGLQPEDWLNMTMPVNIPGTTHEIYPNWRRKLSTPLEAMFQNPDVISLLAEINRRRRQ
ncbi:4-alpha-glucanotransferase [Tolumonas lignilytica]|uniref:4-alpha-glucanotransferase n=1 Tax=Tolumonas lignilytica TaxID=1283284 RepID=UPI000467E426|nr:4-alpha-glucanotransferase [Tolumonas lignilytica]